MARSHRRGLGRQLGRRWLRVSRAIAASSLSALGLVLAHGNSVALAAPNAGSADRIVINDNRAPGGTLEHGVLTLRLEARTGEWHPDGDADPGVLVRAFGEEGKPLRIPGPLIRVPTGTEIHAFIRNSLDSTFIVRGLYTRGGAAADTVQIAPGSVHEMRFTADSSASNVPSRARRRVLRRRPRRPYSHRARRRADRTDAAIPNAVRKSRRATIRLW